MHKIYFIGLDGCMFYAVLLCFVRKQCNSYQPVTLTADFCIAI